MLSDELSFTLFPTLGRVYVCKIPKRACNLECLVPTVKHRGGIKINYKENRYEDVVWIHFA
jgi:hypothetical protein